MSAAALPRKRFTRDEVEQMIELGLFPGQRLELIDGDLIDKMGQLPPHANGIHRLAKLLRAYFGEDRVYVQRPVEVAEDERRHTDPEPDLAVMAGTGADLESRHPRGSELILVVEVADTSLRYDSTGKRDLYARAGVPEYWVLDIKAKRLLVHREPRNGQYTSITALTAGDSVTIGGHSIRVDEMLP
jgi:Uma2 family endonuclease